MTIQKRLLKYSVLTAHFSINRWSWLRCALGHVDSKNGSSHKSCWPLDRSVAYIAGIFDNYLRSSGLAPRMLEGKRIVEIGPGDNLGVALKFLAAGAEKVVSIDRFFSHRDRERERQIYLALRETLGPKETILFDGAVDLKAGIQLNPDRLQYVYGKGVEQVGSILGSAAADVIVSNAVLEEIDDLDSVFSELDRFLRPGGIQVHVIDLRDYGTLSRFGFHALEFCTIPDGIYRYASKFSRPNRLRLDYYRRKMESLSYDSKFLITHVCGRKAPLSPFETSLKPDIDFTAQDLEELRSIRPRLLKRFRNLADGDLLAAGFVLVACKPGIPLQ